MILALLESGLNETNRCQLTTSRLPSPQNLEATSNLGCSVILALKMLFLTVKVILPCSIVYFSLTHYPLSSEL